MKNSDLIKQTFDYEFNQETYEEFLTELLNQPVYEENNLFEYIDKGFEEYIESVYDYGTFEDSEQEEMKLYVVELKRTSSLERARTMQRNFIAKLLSNDIINNALVAFYGDKKDWRFSFVKKTYKLVNGKVEEELSLPARHSYLVGPEQSNHTCKKQFNNLLNYDEITVDEIFKTFEVENVTDEFFKEYKELFHKLTESIEEVKANNIIVKEEFENKKIESTDFAKKILGQLVFLYFIQKKGWLGVNKDQKWGTGPKDFLRRLYNKEFIDYENFFNDVLEYLFYEGLSTSADDDHYSKFNCRVPFINGGIFENINNYNWRETDINIDNKIFEEILDIFDTFNFTVKEDEPLEKEVAIDPEMLGKVFEKLLEVNERKDKGAFYTPRHIVHEICQETLISYLDTNTEDIPKEDIETFIKEGYMAIDSIIRVQEQDIPEQEANEIIPIPNTIIGQMEIIEELLNKVTVVDPAVGSGAFPVGMLTEIVQAKHIIHLLEGYDEVNMYDLKRETIENSLYGVDIIYSATDIAKLRFWLSLIVDEDSIENIRPLPNLDNKIMCGDSVIDTFEGIKLFDEGLLESSTEKQTKLFAKKSEIELKKLAKYKNSYFNENTHSEKIKLKKQIQDTKWNFIEETIKEGTNYKNKEELLEKIKQYKHAESKPFFIWELEFSEVFTGENPGFDIVIGNPPYVRQEKIKEIKPILKQTYETYTGTADLYVYFFEKGIKLLKEKGCLSYICSNKWTKAKYGNSLRSFLKNKTNILIYEDYTGKKIFKDASVDTSVILIFNNFSTKNEIRVNKEFYLKQELLSDYNWSFKPSNVLELHRKLMNKGVKLKEINNTTIKYGIKTGYDKAFVIDKEIRDELIKQDSKNNEIIKPLIRGRDVEKWKLNFNNEYLICTKNGIDVETEFPIIFKYLSQFEEQLSKRYDQGSHWSNLRSCTYYDKFDEMKIIYPNIASNIACVLDNNKYYINPKCYMINSEDINLKYLIALLNSKLMAFIFSLMGSPLGEKGFDLHKQFIEQLPIIIPSKNQEQIFDKYVEEIQDKIKKNDNQIDELENKINNMVYQLYDLKYYEIEIIENNIK